MTDGSADLARFLREERERVDCAMAEIALEIDDGPSADLGDSIEYALATRGKRLRPILVVAAYKAAIGGSDAPVGVYRLACAVEIVHTYSLVHDDLPCMDDDDLRRGRPTVHRVHGVRRATLAGAALLPLAMGVLDSAAVTLGLPRATRGRLVSELCRAAGAEGMVGGQLLDLEGEAGGVDLTSLEAIHRAKTGALLAASLRIGAIAAGAEASVLEALTRYGESLGLAFQIADDILDVTGDSESLGKTAGRDEVLRKASYPSLYGLDRARDLAADRCVEAKAALTGLVSPELRALADYVVTRRA
ncbi:MAG TPA: farnesyl diphosphate synthase [Longimicrobiaceae bacterium]|nr:farnesyl diphosphate synthase [Longimicrobiaceae bacterium]